MEDTVVVKSDYDIRDYKVIQLENGLEALIVHDPRVVTRGGYEKEGGQIKMSAAAMSIGVGGLHSPKRVQGLPHLLEHMLVEGSNKYSENNGYLSYISEHGGFTHEFTSIEHCNFSFQVNGKFLKGALKRFADCFIAPLLTKETLEAEINAVDSEFNEKKGKWWRVHDALLSHTSRRGHPCNNVFSCGNRESLMGKKVDCQDLHDELFKKKKDLHDEVKKFHSKKYHAKKMKLVVIGGETLDKLQDWIEKLFNSIKECPVKKVESKKRKRKRLPKRPIWKSGEKYRLVLETLDDDILVVSWTLLSLRKVYEHKPDRYIAYFLNQEGKGSLISLLKDEGLAEYLIAEIGGGICSTANMFSITIGLTNSGTFEINKIISLIYEYLTLLRDSPPEWMFQEIQSIGELEFNFGEESNQREYAVKLSENLLNYPPKHVVCAENLYDKWSEPLIKQVLGYFVPENMRVDVFSGHVKMEDDDEQVERVIEDDDEQVERVIEDDDEQVEKVIEDDDEQVERLIDDDVAVSKLVPWYGIPYSVQDIEESFMKLWKETQEAREPLQLPCKNEFIPNITSIRVGDIVDEEYTNMIHPTCICDEDSMKLWYKRDCTFKVPFASIYIQIKYSKGVWENAKTCVLSELFLSLLCDKLHEVKSKARKAMLKSKVRFIDGMLEVKVYGLNEMLPNLLSKVLSEVNSFMPTDNSRYEFMKENVKRTLMEGEDVLLETLLRQNIYASNEKLTYIDDLSLDDVRKFIEEIRSQIFIEGLVHGNFSLDDTNNICNIIKEIIPKNSLPIIGHVEKVICLTPKTNFVVNYPGTSNNISTAQLYIQIGHNLFNSLKQMALLDLFDAIVEKPFFDQMRTKEHLGYTVESFLSEIHNVWGFCFLIHSSDCEPYYLQRKIEEFIDGLEKVFIDLDNKTFNNYRSSLVEKLQSCSSLKDESYQVWEEITKYSCQFNINQKVAVQLEQVTKKDFMKFYREYFKKSSCNCRRLKINVWSEILVEEAADYDSFDRDENVDPEENPDFY